MKGKLILKTTKKRKVFLAFSLLFILALVKGFFVWKNTKTNKIQVKSEVLKNQESEDKKESVASNSNSNNNSEAVVEEEQKKTEVEVQQENTAPSNQNQSTQTNTQRPTSSAPATTNSQTQSTVPSTGGQTTPTTPKIYSISEAESYVEGALLSLINAERSRVGVGQLAFNGQMAQAADIRANEESDFSMTSQNHNRPDGRSFDTVFAEVGYSGYTSWGENLVYGYQSLPELNKTNLDTLANKMFTNWKNSSGHYDNMIRSTFNQTGFGVNLVSQSGRFYYFGIELFARK